VGIDPGRVHVVSLTPFPVPLSQLVDEAQQRWLVEEEGVADDITAIVVRFAYAGRPAVPAERSAAPVRSQP
jgi:hypothetical protein